VLALALAVLGTAPAAAAILTPTPSPLPGSSFQGGDGNQDAVTGLADWETLQTAGRVVHANDPNAQDSAFVGGSKENRPGEWDFTTERDGVSPSKANILDGWGSAGIFGSRTFLYLAFARAGSQGGGTTFLTFELNRASRLWNNGRALVPCRHTGDVLISYEPHGNDVEVIVQRWVTDPDGADADSGCARTGRLEDVALTPNVDVQGAMNRSEIDNFLDGAGAKIDADRFGEAAIDFEKVLGAVRGGCFAFASAWMHSRSSTADSSNMQDYVEPVRIDLRRCAASGTKFFDSDADGQRDPGEPGLARFLIFADYDGDGRRDAGEPFAVTDENGRYVIDDIRPPTGSYTLRERPLRRGRDKDWRCSHPGPPLLGPGPLDCGWGPISVAQEPYARQRDFGNWFPAEPPEPPGPPEPPTPQPPTPPGTTPPADTLAPPGPTPPAAGVAGSVALSPLKRCLRRGSVVRIRGERIAGVRVFVAGRLVRGLRVRPLQHLVRIRLLRDFRPGRYRVTARIRFERGSATPPLTLVRRVRVCSRPPRFTG
jgi:hypothetical protein